MTTICTSMNKKGLDPSGWVIGISIICTLLPRWDVGSQRLLQGWSPPLETAVKREEQGLGVLLALCQGMIAGTRVGFSLWKGLDVCLDMCGWPGILWQPFQNFSHQWVNASLKENDFFLSWTYPEVTAWKKASLLSVISMSMDLLMPKESFWLFSPFIGSPFTGHQCWLASLGRFPYVSKENNNSNSATYGLKLRKAELKTFFLLSRFPASSARSAWLGMCLLRTLHFQNAPKLLYAFIPPTLNEDSTGFQSHSNSSQGNGPQVISTWNPVLPNESYNMVFISVSSG